MRLRAACFFTNASLPLPLRSSLLSTETHLPPLPPATHVGVVRALDERLLEAAAPAPAETEAEEPGAAAGDGSGEGEGDGVGPSWEQAEEQQPPRVPVRSRRRQQEQEATMAEHDRFKLMNGKEIFQQKAYLVGVECKKTGGNIIGVEESLKELEQLVDTAGCWPLGCRFDLSKASSGSPSPCLLRLSTLNPRTYIGSGKVAEIKSAIHALDIETVIFDDELSHGQLCNLEKSFGGGV